jgi:hypothetical protein
MKMRSHVSFFEKQVKALALRDLTQKYYSLA